MKKTANSPPDYFSQQTPAVQARLRNAFFGRGIVLPRPSKSVGVYVPATVTGETLFVAGHGPLRADRTLMRGKVGADVDLSIAREAAHVTALNMLATINQTLGGLDRLVRPLRILMFINAVPDFTGHNEVLKCFTDVFDELLGHHERPALTVFGAQSLPDGICVEVEAVFQIKHPSPNQQC